MSGYVPAFPSFNGSSETGMTKREHMATQAMAHCMTHYFGSKLAVSDIARRAVMAADALLKELAK